MFKNRLFDFGTLMLVGFVLAIIASGVAAKIVSKQDDSFVEEISEEILEQITGVEVDFSPENGIRDIIVEVDGDKLNDFVSDLITGTK